MSKVCVVGFNSEDKLCFNIRVTERLTLRNVPKERILKSVQDGFYFGLSNLNDLNDNVIDVRKVEIFCKLYLMELTNKLNAWIGKYNQFMSKPLRIESDQKSLVDEYNEIIMDCDPNNIDKEVYKQADKFATRLMELHV